MATPSPPPRRGTSSPRRSRDGEDQAASGRRLELDPMLPSAMERLPFYQRELSDQNDMKTLFDTILIADTDHEQLTKEAKERFLGEHGR
ncbi:MAG: hypothetical protein ACLQF1_16475 [Methyloceanibacter sp.]